jgi:hypothetical protein
MNKAGEAAASTVRLSSNKAQPADPAAAGFNSAGLPKVSVTTSLSSLKAPP